MYTLSPLIDHSLSLDKEVCTPSPPVNYIVSLNQEMCTPIDHSSSLDLEICIPSTCHLTKRYMHYHVQLIILCHLSCELSHRHSGSSLVHCTLLMIYVHVVLSISVVTVKDK